MQEKLAVDRLVIGAAIEVHRAFGPGLLESCYRDALCYELRELSIPFVSEPWIPVRYKRLAIKRAFRPDLVIAGKLIVELKHIEKILAVHEAQVRTYLKLCALKTGILFNFNTVVLKNGIRRIDLR